jgi:tRNA threonylcarbamoyl adenosine modification protein YjeE
MRLDEPGLERWGKRIGEVVDAPVFLGLRGPLGAGKSVLARAIGLGAGVAQAMPSPSFNLVFRYGARSGIEVVHMDLYRVDHPDELTELGWDDLGQPNEIVIVEWPERAGERLPPHHWIIRLEVPPGSPDLRDVSVDRVGSPPELPGFPMRIWGSE